MLHVIFDFGLIGAKGFKFIQIKDEVLEAVMLGDEIDNDIEYVILHNISGLENISNVSQMGFDLNAITDEI